MLFPWIPIKTIAYLCIDVSYAWYVGNVSPKHDTHHMSWNIFIWCLLATKSNLIQWSLWLIFNAIRYPCQQFLDSHETYHCISIDVGKWNHWIAIMLSIYLSVCQSVCLSIYLYTYIYIYIYIYVYIYVHMYKSHSPVNHYIISHCISIKTSISSDHSDGHFRKLNWRYLPYTRPMWGLCKAVYPQMWPEIWYISSILWSWNRGTPGTPMISATPHPNNNNNNFDLFWGGRKTRTT